MEKIDLSIFVRAHDVALLSVKPNYPAFLREVPEEILTELIVWP